MNNRSSMIESIRSEIVGPSVFINKPDEAVFINNEIREDRADRTGPLVWRPDGQDRVQEVLYFFQESPFRKYGAGLLHPLSVNSPSESHIQGGPISDPFGVEQPHLLEEDTFFSEDQIGHDEYISDDYEADDFEIGNYDVRKISTMGISFGVSLSDTSEIVFSVPQQVRFDWQKTSDEPMEVNGRYEACSRFIAGYNSPSKVWRRLPAVEKNSVVKISTSELKDKTVLRRELLMPANSPMQLRLDIFPRRQQENGIWLITAVLRNSSVIKAGVDESSAILYQAYFDVSLTGGSFNAYPQSGKNMSELDNDELSLSLLYRESSNWGIGHGCAAGWNVLPGEVPSKIFADVMPVAELPSMTPDIQIDGRAVTLSMRGLANLSDDGKNGAWDSLSDLSTGYSNWIDERKGDIDKLEPYLIPIATRHLADCEKSLSRINNGINLLKRDPSIRWAFKLANLAMLLQQIAQKQIEYRPLEWDSKTIRIKPKGHYFSPDNIYLNTAEKSESVGSWRAFQIAFLLMSLDGLANEVSTDRDVVDLIWFPTGGGKTEAYLASMSFYMFHQRLLTDDNESLRRDGTNVLMRYTLRMLTTQQFQRAASLICAMESIRRNQEQYCVTKIAGDRFSLGLWIGGDGAPNKVSDAKTALGKYKNDRIAGNPLVLTECPWCRSEMGRYSGPKPPRVKMSESDWRNECVKGVQEGAYLCCPDSACEFGSEHPESWLPVEVIDERIYENPPSIVIATADKFAMAAYRPKAGALFGLQHTGDKVSQVNFPPGLIVQDELHLISGPLGTMYGLYEGVIEKFCSFTSGGLDIKPKIISSTATVRGAEEQIRALYARDQLQLFPSPGLTMGDSFFGKYATENDGRLKKGRLYLGVHANDYSSVLTAQVRAFSSALFRPTFFDEGSSQDPWWTLLAFYNSIRELGGARTLFDSDIRSRLKFMFNREGVDIDSRRNLKVIQELTSRLAQSEIVSMMDQLSVASDDPRQAIAVDACLASNIIEVGVDIDRLSLMAVVGQPKTTATYIQVTGRVGRRWWERPGLILTLYNPFKSRDRSHFEQFQSYHSRLYEQVEPTTATPFSVSAIERGLAGALITWARQKSTSPVQRFNDYRPALDDCFAFLKERCEMIQVEEDRDRSISALERARDQLYDRWEKNPLEWEKFPQNTDGEYLMLWPGQYATAKQKRCGKVIPSSLRQVDRSGELEITQGYVMRDSDS